MTVEELQIIISAKTEKVQSKIARLKKNIASIQPKKSADVNVTTGKALGNLKKLQAEVGRTEAKITKLNEKMAGVYEKQDAIVNKYTGLPNLTGMTQDQSLDFMVGNDPQMQKLGAQLDKLDAQTAPLKAHLAEVREKIAQVGKASGAASGETKRFGETMRNTGNRIQRAGKNGINFGRAVKYMMLSMVLYRGVFFILQSVSQGLQNMALGNAQANSTMSQLATSALYLKNSIAASLMPALQAITPVFNQVADAVAGVFNNIAMLTARIFNHASTVTIAKRANVDYAATLDKTKASADAAKKSLMGFDEINTLSKPSAASSSSGSPGMPAAGDMFQTVQIPSWVEKIGEVTDKIKQIVEDNIDSIRRLLRLAPLVLGAILAFSGANVPLGIGLMAVGAVEMAQQVKEDWGYLSSNTNSSLDKVKKALAITGAVELAVGAIFAFSGANIPLGIGLMIGGIATTAATLKWDSMGSQLKQSISEISFASGEAMLVLGAILAFSGVGIPVGIALMLGGATAIASAAVTNWNSMNGQLKSTLTTIMTTVGAAALALGAVLAFSGVALPLGIGLILLGAANLAGAAALNWDTVKNKIKTVLADILAIISVSSAAIGLLLCLTGAGIPLGIGLILAGMAGVHAASSISTNPVTKWAKDLMNGVISVFESGVNYIISMINKISLTVPDWVKGIGGKTFGFHISPVHIPRMAAGGVVTGPTYSLIGEGRDNEAVLPLNDTVYSSIAKGISENDSGAGGADFSKVIERLDRLEAAILNRPINLYANDENIAASANRGNQVIDRRNRPVVNT